MLKNETEKYVTISVDLVLTTSILKRILKRMRYTIKDLQKQFPNDDACLDAIFDMRYGDVDTCPKCGVVGTKFYRVTGRKCYACMHCGYQLHPLAQTIFHKSETPLTTWFYVMFQVSVAKNGMSAKEVARSTGVTYKTAHRMLKMVRSLMLQGTDFLSGIVEVDETYVGGVRKKKYRDTKTQWENKTAVIGIVEKNGMARTLVTKHADATVTIPFMKANIAPGSTVHTDESKIYSRVRRDFDHAFVNHSKFEYVKSGVTTNTIEGLWGNWKNSLRGTYHAVSPKYLQAYVNEFVFRYNYRGVAVYPVLLELASKRVAVET